MIVWTDYFKYRADLRGFDLTEVEKILIFGNERYFDTATGRNVIIGKHGRLLVLIPYERIGDSITPVTIHATTRQQINFRLKNGRFSHE
jgi:hypothetical protein